MNAFNLRANSQLVFTIVRQCGAVAGVDLGALGRLAYVMARGKGCSIAVASGSSSHPWS